VNQIRPRVKAWREAGYPGITGITKRLLEHWNNPDEREHQFFFCQLEAMETVIWLAEAPASEKVGIDIASDGGAFTRLLQNGNRLRQNHRRGPRRQRQRGKRARRRHDIHDPASEHVKTAGSPARSLRTIIADPIWVCNSTRREHKYKSGQ
jgi:hypothetical protein